MKYWDLKLRNKARRKIIKTLRKETLLSYPCAYCGEKSETVDHVRPKRDNGSNNVENTVPACGECNRVKGCLSPMQLLDRCQKIVAKMLVDWEMCPGGLGWKPSKKYLEDLKQAQDETVEILVNKMLNDPVLVRRLR